MTISVRGVGGPMARDVDGLVLMMKALLVPLHFQLDTEVVPIPFRTEVYHVELLFQCFTS